MAKDIKIGVHRGDGAPEFRWNVLVLDLAFQDAMQFLTPTQYQHISEQIRELAREIDPTHPVTQTVSTIEDFLS